MTFYYSPVVNFRCDYRHSQKNLDPNSPQKATVSKRHSILKNVIQDIPYTIYEMEAQRRPPPKDDSGSNHQKGSSRE